MIDKKTEYMDNADRVEVERSFSLAKRCYGLGRLMTKLDSTARSSIALFILVMNVARIRNLFYTQNSPGDVCKVLGAGFPAVL